MEGAREREPLLSRLRGCDTAGICVVFFAPEA